MKELDSEILERRETSEVLFGQLIDFEGKPTGEKLVKRSRDGDISAVYIGGLPGSGKTTVLHQLAHEIDNPEFLFFDNQLRLAESSSEMGPRDEWSRRDWRIFSSAYLTDKIDELSENLPQENTLLIETPILGVTDRGVSSARAIAEREEGPRNKYNTLFVIVIATPEIHERAARIRQALRNVPDEKVMEYLRTRFNTLITGVNVDETVAETGNKIKKLLAGMSRPEEVGKIDLETAESSLIERASLYLTEGIVPEKKERLSEEVEVYLQAAELERSMTGFGNTSLPPQMKKYDTERREKMRLQATVALNLRRLWQVPKKNWMIVFNTFRKRPMHYLDLSIAYGENGINS